jgi:nicotinamide-nucleotide amidase
MNSDDEIFRSAMQVSQHLALSDRTLVTAESCTGGWLGKALTDIPGSSRWYLGGVVAYSNGLKQQLLSVTEESLVTHGAVSDAVVSEMATGALRNFKGDIAVAISGIAGPDGEQPGKPVGTVWIAWAWRHGQSIHVNARLKLFTGDREEVRRRSVIAALSGLMEV